MGWFASDGEPLTKKPVKVTVAFVTGEALAEVEENVTVDINKPYSEAKVNIPARYETTNLTMGVPLKCTLKNAYYVGYGNSCFFDYDCQTKMIYPKMDALKTGKIVPGVTYKMKFYFKDMLDQDLPEKTVKIHVKKPDTARAEIVQKEVKLSNRAAHAKAFFEISTIQPYYGMKVKSVTLSGKDASDFAVINHTNHTNQYTYEKNSSYALIYKNSKLPKNLKAGSRKVDLTVTYENGATAKVKLPVVIY